MSFPKYESHKDSCVEWLDEVPAHWRISRLGYEAWVRARLGWKGLKAEEYVDDGYAFLATPNIKGSVIDFGNVNFIDHFRYEESPEIKLRVGDILLAKDGSTLGTVNIIRVLPIPATVNSSIAVISPHSNLDSIYGYYLFQSYYIENTIQRIKGGMGVPHLFQDDLNRFYIPLPSLAEQASIASFLDRETANIDALIDEQKKLIELLKEKRQAVISRAVIKGLDPDVPMKDSGVEWLGEIPAHWMLEKFSRCVQIAEGQVDPRKEPFASMVLIAPNHVESITGRLLFMETAVEQGAESGKYLCQAGDVIYSKIRPALAKAVLTPVDALCSADMYPMRGRNGLAEQYLLWLLLSPQFTAWSVMEADRVAMPKINREALSDLRLPLPPKQEQAEICAYLDRETCGVDNLLLQAETANALLQERRSALISAAVTGKIDVRDQVQQQIAAE
ncbi:hypothetical protein ASD64_05485 [Mesorhizobium sp. Root157]|uniref:restriction endonuclease subunit S n=1 Tax=Mesorhizobium sp. Root157 TaxID=1736477 RepID=UPI0006FF991D|nr:restriction endonuclease subunit S [Mesorhizobium sp. Root157]KQZ94308.1 hypothetical protein ASD64_05485 [Mesorhizobium sp. Root157]